MGADVVIMSDITPSSQDFIDAFALTSCKQVLVFSNSANSILAAMQASSLCKDKKVTVLNSRSIAECFFIKDTFKEVAVEADAVYQKILNEEASEEHDST